MKKVIELTMADKVLTTEQLVALGDILRDAADKISKITDLRSVTLDNVTLWPMRRS